MVKKKGQPVPTAPYEPTAGEKVVIERYQARVAARRRFPELKATTDGSGVAQIASDHKDETTALALQLDALGLGSHHEFTSILKGVCNFTSHRGAVSAGNMTEAIALVVGMEPQNTTEAMLSVQMAAVHLATMEAARRLNVTASNAEAISVNTKALNNLTRTFAMQAETMKKLKGGGEQKVTVEHRHYHLASGAIAPGSQAVLGDVKGGGGQSKMEHQPHERLHLSEREAVLGYLEAHGMPVSSAGSEGLERVPLPRGEGRSANGHG